MVLHGGSLYDMCDVFSQGQENDIVLMTEFQHQGYVCWCKLQFSELTGISLEVIDGSVVKVSVSGT